MKIIIKNAKIVDSVKNEIYSGNLYIKDGCFSEEFDDADRVIEANGKYALPGIVDLHVHFRDPGQIHKEDVFTGSAAAASGGVTSVVTMPNTTPVMDNTELLSDYIKKCEQCDIRIFPCVCITKGMKSGELVDMAALAHSGAMAFSDDGRPVESAELMEQALINAHKLGVPVFSHSEILELAEGGKLNEGKVSRKLGIKGMPREAEEQAILREVTLAKKSDTPVHICHVSTAGSLDIIRKAKKQGVKVTCETGPHYFIFTEEELYKKDADYRMNPPLRCESDRQAVIEGLLDGTIDAIATDHAPHAAEEKADFTAAPNGVIGLQTSLSASYTALVKGGKLDMLSLARLMCENPAKIGRLPVGQFGIGSAADIVLFDPEEEWTVEKQSLAGKSKNTPFKGMKLAGKVKLTICRGKIIFEDK